MSMMEHPLWHEEVEISDVRLEERPHGIPGAIKIHWQGAGGPHSLGIPGNRADDLMERYRSAPDAEHRELVLRHAILEGVQP